MTDSLEIHSFHHTPLYKNTKICKTWAKE